jgi:hypothetical protein
MFPLTSPFSAILMSATRVIEYNVPHYYFVSPPPSAFAQGVALEVFGQTHRSDLNGKFAVCLRRDGMRTLVMMRHGDTLSISDQHLRTAEIAVGARVTLVGLQGEFNGAIAHIAGITENGDYTVTVSDPSTSVTLTVKPVNVVLTPEGTDTEPSGTLIPFGGAAGKKRRLIANLVSSTSDAGMALGGAPGLLSGQPIAGATARLIAIDAAVALSNLQPILKRCGTLRKLVHGFPGFAQLVVCLVAKLHRDPTHPGRKLAPEDAPECLRIAQLLTDGKMDGIPRRELRELVASGECTLETVLRLADRYCGAVHLVFALDSNFAGVRDTITNMVQDITGEKVQQPQTMAAADLLMKDDDSAPKPAVPLPIDTAIMGALASRYAMDTSEDK